MRKTFLTLLLALGIWHAKAQIVPSYTEKTIIELEGEARGGSPKEHPNTDGHGYAHVYTLHNFIYSNTTKLGIDGRYEVNNGDNHYFRFGPRGSHTFKLKNSHPLSLSANIYGEASNHAVERIDGFITGVYGFDISQNQQEGIGLIVLLNNPQSVPCVPIYIFHHIFNKQWSVNFMTYMASVNYDYNNRLRLSAGYNMFTEKNWLSLDHKRYYISKSYFSPQVAMQWKVSPRFKLSANMGYRMPINSIMYNRSGSHKVKKLKKYSAPFISVRATFAWK